MKWMLVTHTHTHTLSQATFSITLSHSHTPILEKEFTTTPESRVHTYARPTTVSRSLCTTSI